MPKLSMYAYVILIYAILHLKANIKVFNTLIDFQNKNYYSKATWKGQYWGSNIDLVNIKVKFLSFLR